MLSVLDIFLLVVIVFSAIAALSVRDLIGSAIVLGAHSFLMCLLWAGLMAVDVAFTEAAVGAGVSTVFILATVLKIDRWSEN